ncbi:hypothetical protein [Teredinibacter sp. KSP-S5-2]|uniref:hypothetical protein n=1 Tax=Teredinibacter sp. KSP-S5-2 TaxID=3034506 RepID=UPI002934F054|nr:hypothetical protein [Teredinibacter sp. KSP-S5-2]WNO09672.1 hypothetical protein P5V12_00570 [Teredinibacter sp. KSP-S5-2]
MDFEVSADLAPSLSADGRFKFSRVATFFKNHATPARHVHTHQTASAFSSPDRYLHQTINRGNEYLVSDNGIYKFRGVDYNEAVSQWVDGGKLGVEPNNRGYYQVYDDSSKSWMLFNDF